tara:strand:- start:450 stop:1406 length:957 start_codon:yes stop_codon:yes gene_type:complete
MRKRKTLNEKLLLIIKGFAMGAINKVPGVSGGIIALVGGFYVELVYSLQKINIKSLKLLISGRWTAFLNYINYEFLFYLFGGSLLSFFSMAVILDYLLINYPNYLWSLFFGMVLSSIYFIIPLVKKWNLRSFIFFSLGTFIGLCISFLKPMDESQNLYFIFFCGIISVSGMTLPGLSGSFILLLMGNYELLLVDSVNALYFSLIDFFGGNFKFLYDIERIKLIKILIVFTAGSIAGLLFYVNLLSYVLKKFYSYTIAMICGFVSGSIICVWPWKTKFKKEITYFFPKEINQETIMMLICITLGVGLVYVLENYGKEKN